MNDWHKYSLKIECVVKKLLLSIALLAGMVGSAQVNSKERVVFFDHKKLFSTQTNKHSIPIRIPVGITSFFAWDNGYGDFVYKCSIDNLEDHNILMYSKFKLLTSDDIKANTIEIQKEVEEYYKLQELNKNK